MNLEDIEQKTLRYLSQVSNPLVRVETLRAHLREEEGFGSLSDGDLLDFLAHHELFRVIEPPGFGGDRDQTEALREAGLHPGTCVVLDTRVPSDSQTISMMAEQLDSMRGALKAALVEAHESQGSGEATDTLRQMLERLEGIQKRLGTSGLDGDAARADS